MTTRIALLALALALTAACGGASTTSSTSLQAAPPPAPAVTHAPVAAVTTVPHPVPSFRTPEAAMRYMADAWNRGDAVSLRHVTDASARNQLWNMHREATNLHLVSCRKLPAGDFGCEFSHDYPTGYRGAAKRGSAYFIAGPATRGGWYMTQYVDCG